MLEKILETPEILSPAQTGVPESAELCARRQLQDGVPLRDIRLILERSGYAKEEIEDAMIRLTVNTLPIHHAKGMRAFVVGAGLTTLGLVCTVTLFSGAGGDGLRRVASALLIPGIYLGVWGLRRIRQSKMSRQ